jgi:hypothetical protein
VLYEEAQRRAAAHLLPRLAQEVWLAEQT